LLLPAQPADALQSAARRDLTHDHAPQARDESQEARSAE
jgi:hypothetical protein